MNTEKVVERFWSTMAQRYGARWFDTYSDKPTQAWRDCVDAYTPREMAKAIDMLDLKEHTRQHPPTEPEFRALLKAAARGSANKVEDAGEMRRGYWRSCIIEQVSRNLGYDSATLEPVVVANKSSLGRAMKDLLDEVDESEQRTGQRTPGHSQMVFDGAQRIAVAFNQLRAAVPT